jgi:hypothetical protein
MAYLIVWDLLPPFRNVESIFRGIVDLGKVFLFFAGGGRDGPAGISAESDTFTVNTP